MVCRGLNFLNGYMEQVQEKTRENLCILGYFMLFFFALLYGTPVLPGVHLLVKCIIGTAIMAWIILFSLNGPVKRPQWDPVLAVMWFGMGILQLISGFLVSLEYLPMACIWIVGFPLLFLVWTSRGDYEALFRDVALGANMSLVIMLISSAVLVPLDGNGYGGVFRNENAVGQWITFGYPIVIFLLLHTKSTWKKILYQGEIAWIVLFCVLSRGRTALLALISMTIIFVIVYLCFRPDPAETVIKKILSFLMAAVIFTGTFWGINQIGKITLGTQNHANVGHHAHQQVVTETVIPIETLIPATSQDPEMDVEKPQNPGNIEKLIIRILGLDKASHSLLDYSSGRTGIWVKALEKANMWGHPSAEHIITERNGDVGSNVHNLVFQFIYDNGILAGILFAVMMLYAGIKILIRTIQGRSIQKAELCVLLIHVGFAVTAMLASPCLPFIYTITFVYYLSYALLMDKRSCTKKV